MLSDNEQMLADCEIREAQLTEWEHSFIASIGEQIDDGLTPKQVETLERIWNRVT